MIDAYLVGDAEIARKFDLMPNRLREELKVGIGRAIKKLAYTVRKDKLNGQVLNVRSGRLGRSIASHLEDTSTLISGIVSTPVAYAPAHEYGFKGSVTVREHMRQIKQAFGRPIEPKSVTVRAHSMQMNLPERSFLRSALREMEASGGIRMEIDGAIQRAIK